MEGFGTVRACRRGSVSGLNGRDKTKDRVSGDLIQCTLWNISRHFESFPAAFTRCMPAIASFQDSIFS